MITKKVPMKNPRKSSFSSLTKYLVDDQGKQERVGDIIISNCHSLDPQWASLEVEATQALNTRATSDKTYHLLISFREGEDLSPETLKDIERQMAEGLGFGEHQRIAVVHRDTDNLHMHVAINKIHPETHNLHEPYRDHRTRDELCVKIENQYGLEKDNHKVRYSSSENKAADMENMSGLESLLSFSKSLSPDLSAAKTWGEFHDRLAENGLVIKPKGNGLIIQNSEGITVKASSVAREFSKNSLEKKFGKYEISNSNVEAVKTYNPTPIDKASLDLYEQYLNERETFNTIRGDLLGALNKKQKSEVANLKRMANLKRQTIKLAKGFFLKRIALKHISKQLQRDIQKANKSYYQKRNETYQNYKNLQWQDWLKRKAAEGNVDAIKALRRRKKKKYLLGNTLSSSKVTRLVNEPVNGARISYVTSKGNVVYKVANTEIRDDGTRFKVAFKSTLKGKEAALRMAIQRFGSHLKISGSDKFKMSIARLVVSKGIEVTFDDKHLENFKNKLLTNPNSKESYYDRQDRRPRVRKPIERSRSDGARVTRARKEQQNSSNRPSTRIDPRRDYDNWRLRKSNFGKLGRIPPPEAQNNLRGMSKLGVVHIAGRGEVLLQGNVPDNMVKQGEKPNTNMRRDISRTRRVDNLPPHITKFKENSIKPDKTDNNFQYDVSISTKPIDKYVNERNTKSSIIADISKHKVFEKTDAGQYTYKGYRNVDDQLLVLLDKPNITVVVEVDKKVVNRLKQSRVGSKVNLSSDGKITLLGRKRTR